MKAGLGTRYQVSDFHHLAADSTKIVRADTLHQQETGIGLGAVGDQMRGFRCYVVGVADGELAGARVSIDSVPSNTKYQSVTAL